MSCTWAIKGFTWVAIWGTVKIFPLGHLRKIGTFWFCACMFSCQNQRAHSTRNVLTLQLGKFPPTNLLVNWNWNPWKHYSVFRIPFCSQVHSLFQLWKALTNNIHHGEGKDPHQHCCHWTRRLWQVHLHWSLDLQMWRYRQENHWEVREGSPGSKCKNKSIHKEKILVSWTLQTCMLLTWQITASPKKKIYLYFQFLYLP